MLSISPMFQKTHAIFFATKSYPTEEVVAGRFGILA